MDLNRENNSQVITLKDGVDKLKQEHESVLDEANKGCNNKIKAMTQLHTYVLNNKNVELRSIANLGKADKKSHNLVSTIVFFNSQWYTFFPIPLNNYKTISTYILEAKNNAIVHLENQLFVYLLSLQLYLYSY